MVSLLASGQDLAWGGVGRRRSGGQNTEGVEAVKAQTWLWNWRMCLDYSPAVGLWTPVWGLKWMVVISLWAPVFKGWMGEWDRD